MTINIVMQDETVMLEGATIVGNKRVNNGMMDVSERDLTTAMSRISMSDLEDGMTAPVWKMPCRDVLPVWILPLVRVIRGRGCRSESVVRLP